jgi:hypothetical protein
MARLRAFPTHSAQRIIYKHSPTLPQVLTLMKPLLWIRSGSPA